MKKYLLSNLLIYFAITFLFFSLAVYITYPLLFNLGSLISGMSDDLLVPWVQQWSVYALVHSPLDLFDAPIFYPLSNTLAYSHLQLTSTLISWLPSLFLNEPAGIYNISVIASFFLSGFSMFLLTYFLTKNYVASILTGVLFIFSPIFIDRRVHIQLLGIYGLPLSVLAFLYYIKSKKIIYFILTLIAAFLQSLNNFITGYFVFFAITIVSLFHITQKRETIRVLCNKRTIGISFIFLLTLLPFALPYFSVSQEFAYTRDIRETIHTAIQPEDLLHTNIHSRLYQLLNSLPFNQHPDVKNGFYGLSFFMLVILSVIYSILKKERYLILFLIIGFIGLILSLGPFLHFGRETIHQPFPIPLPYVLFYYLLPGFQGFRDSSSFMILSIFGFAIAIGIFFNSVKKHMSKHTSIFFAVIFMVLAIIEFQFPMPYQKLISKKDFPFEHKFLMQSPKDTAYVEMPMYVWNMQPYVIEETKRQYYSTLHFRRSLNGASGFTPPPWEERTYWLLQNFPNSKSIDMLKKLEIKYVIVHLDEYQQMYEDNFSPQGRRVKSAEKMVNELSGSELKLEKIVGDTHIYTLK